MIRGAAGGAARRGRALASRRYLRVSPSVTNR